MSDVTYRAKLALMRILEKAPDSIGTVSSVSTDAGHWIPTFDDGPTSERTPQILEALGRHDATATFFVLVTSVRANRALLREVVAAGHEIGLHGQDHRHLSLLSATQVRETVRAGKAELEDALGTPVQWFRPPYGDQTIAAWKEITDAGLTSVLWSATSHDWNPFVNNDTRVVKVASALTEGAIVLFHDGFASQADGADDGPEPRLDRAELIDRVLTVGDQRGLRGRSLADALAAGGRLVTRPHFNVWPTQLNARNIEKGRAATYAKAQAHGLV